MTRTSRNRKDHTDIGRSAVPSSNMDTTEVSSGIIDDTHENEENWEKAQDIEEENIAIVNHTSDRGQKSVMGASGRTSGKSSKKSTSSKKTSGKRTAVRIGDNTITGRKSDNSPRNSHLSNHDLKNGKTILMTVVTIAIIIILGLSVALSVTASSNSRSTEADESATEATLTVFDDTMPKDAASEALQWFDDTLASYDDDMKDGYLDSDGASSDLANLADGDDSKIPDSIKNAFYWNTDVVTDGKTVDENTLKAAGYTAVMSSWQLRTTARQQNPELALNKNLVYVDRTHGTVIIPAEAWCGLPAELVIQLVWNGKDWKIDGASVATQITARMRAAQLRSMTSEDSSSDSSSGE